MAELTFWDRVREWVGGIFFALYLWSARMTEEDFWNQQEFYHVEMSIQPKEYAQRKALELFDAWNDVTGCFPKFTGYYYEICAVIKDSVEIGSMVALGVEFEIKDGVLTQAVEGEKKDSHHSV